MHIPNPPKNGYNNNVGRATPPRATEPIRYRCTVFISGDLGILNFKITCRCGRYITKNDDLMRLNYYKVRRPILKRTSKNERIIEETFYHYVCPQCDNDVVVIKRKAVNAVGNKKILLPEKLIGLRAVEYLHMTQNDRIDKTHELRYSQREWSCKGVPMSYFKAKSATVQQPRYINEIGNSGKPVTSEIKIYS